MTGRRHPIGAAALLLVASIGACVSRVEPADPGSANRTDPQVAGTLVIEQFLRAVNTADIDQMAQLFGTSEAPFARLYAADQVRARMLLMADILKHRNYEVLRMTAVPGRRGEAVTADVRMNIGAKTHDVPYTLVWSQSGRWLIECIELQVITGTGSGAACR